MYRTIIKLKKNIPADRLTTLTKTVKESFNNRAGRLENHSADPYEFIFEGEDEQAFNCIHLAIAELTEPKFIELVSEWDWIDEEDPDDCGSVIDSYYKYYAVN